MDQRQHLAAVATLILTVVAISMAACESTREAVAPDARIAEPVPEPYLPAPTPPSVPVEPELRVDPPEPAPSLGLPRELLPREVDELALSPARALFDDARRARSRGDLDEAVALYRQAVVTDAEHHLAWAELFDMLRDGPDSAAAADACAGLLASSQLQGHAASSRNLQCASVHYAAGRLEDAARYARDSLATSARLEPVITLSGILLAQRRPDEVVSLLRETVQTEGGGPLEASALSNLGAAYLQLSRWDDAVTALLAARDLSPRRTDILINLSDALVRAGRTEESRNALDRVLELDPSNQAALDRLQ